MKKLLTAIISITALASCSNYYKTVTTNGPASNIEELKKNNRYFILRDGNNAFTMQQVNLSADKKSMQCTLELLPYEHTTHTSKKEKSKMKYKKNGENAENSVLDEVHLYITPDSTIATGSYTLPLDKVNKTEVIEEDKIRTKRSHRVGVIVGIGVGVASLGLILALSLVSIPAL